MSEQDRSQRLRKSLAEARLVEIAPDEFPDRIREIKQVAIGRLGELLEKDAGVQEPRSVAHALGTLRRLEARLSPEAEHGKTEPADAGDEAKVTPEAS